MALNLIRTDNCSVMLCVDFLWQFENRKFVGKVG